MLTTRPYYRSSYVFVYRSDSGLKIDSFDNPELRKLRIGVQLIGDDGTNTPPAHELSARGIVDNVKGYTVYGDYTEKNPQAGILHAVAAGEIDVAIVWGPVVGYFARQEAVPLTLIPVSGAKNTLPFAFDIAVGVRRSEKALRDEINAVLEKHSSEIDGILREMGIPLISSSKGEATPK